MGPHHRPRGTPHGNHRGPADPARIRPRSGLIDSQTAYGGKGAGWGVSARSGRRPSQSPAQRDRAAGPRTDTPHPGPDPQHTARATPAPTGAAQAAAGTQGRGELRKTPAPTEPAAAPQAFAAPPRGRKTPAPTNRTRTRPTAGGNPLSVPGCRMDAWSAQHTEP
ncbi:predicted protein [Streptomyces sviceus ATCC 29083]|uniref:Uncharacterized protein n=1 Tax=Streptomyces sviceus (strain ATCC 29083 / DSM 924 / JCM 4929 / NBRC 13980 / NCIMB 11184 / NRRL 5439 / UC 5370) TaxID=463191 RepID=D6XAT3_STRX2|nr:predicted protein [Streptomyces sviceus ATCC 29083]